MGPAAGLIGATYAECNKETVTVFFILGMGLMGFFYPSLKVNCLDLSPNYAGTVMALVNGIGAVSGIVTPYLVGLLITDVRDLLFTTNTNSLMESLRIIVHFI